uniref:protein-tyrosine-phosphatase n=1 Tax=Ditylenchus dipsaci TaxID=166011 RepID=A0A915EGL5_9BILA
MQMMCLSSLMLNSLSLIICQQHKKRSHLINLPNLLKYKNPSRLLNVYLPQFFHSFKQFIARVTDISNVVESRLRDANRTFLASLADSSLINIHGLNPGHRYSIAILGRREAESTLIKEESVIMDPVSLDFSSTGAVQTSFTNITMRLNKPERALQDIFRVEYMQVEPPKRYPILDVNDIEDQKQVELYLGNLNPGRDFLISVTSLKDDLPSKPWKEIVTTKPLRPDSLAVTEINSTCVKLNWMLSPESGVDIFKVAYGVLHGQNNMVKTETPNTQQDLCDMLPGQTYVFAVIAEKSHQISDPATISHTVRPAPPTDLSVEADFEKAKFRIHVELAPQEKSKSEKCSIMVSSEQGSDGTEQIVKVQVQDSLPSCDAFVDLIPGKASISGQKSSTKVLRSTALEPGFDFKAFGLSIQESNAGSIRLQWPNSEVSRLRVMDLWSKIVGNDSRLHFTLNPQTDELKSHEREPVKQVETTPVENISIIIDQLKRGACYKVHLYTVTSSGIVSKHRFEQYFRLSSPLVEVAIGQITKSSAMIQAFVIKGASDLMTTTGSYASAAISSECVLNIVVLDGYSVVVYDKTLVLKNSGGAPSLPLAGLRPFFKYTVNSQVICGQSPDNAETCPPKPGQVQNISTKPLNPYSVQLSWYPPALRNGLITHYIVHIMPEDPEEKPWSVNVAANLTPHVFFMNDGSESLLPVNSTAIPPVEATIDNLTGGEVYRMNVVAVTEAGAGEIPLEIKPMEMPVAAPPLPSFLLEIIPNSVKSQELTVRYNTDLAQVQAFDTWPPYVAIESMPEGKRFLPRMITEVIGGDPLCADRDTANLRLYTAPNLWTDTLYSEIATTEALKGDVSVRGVFALLTVIFLCCLLAIALFLFYTRQRENRKAEVILVEKILRTYVSNSYTSSTFGCVFGRDFGSEAGNTTHSNEQGEPVGALKMMMAERAADCLAKLGLDTPASSTSAATTAHLPHSPPTTTTDTNKFNFSSSTHLPSVPVVHEPLRVLGGRISPPEASPIMTDLSASKLQPPGEGMQNGLAHNSPNGPFNTHHRRSKSLRERTGVDQRLERLPANCANSSLAGQKSVLWTVVKSQLGVDKSRPIRLCDFSEHVRLMSADSDFRFSEEYEDLRLVGIGQSCIAADLSVNRAKNRFTNILPYDHSRVKLQATDDEDGSDYINASYMPGFNGRREFIAAQGPLPSTRDHFWRLVWEQQCPAIVALTKCVEKGRDKCHQYWPDNGQRTVLYADIEVTLLNESIDYEEFTVRELRLTNLAEPSQQPRTVQHLHYMAWPDFGVPDHPAGIVHFARLFRNKLPASTNNKPTIVHCSAGVGRSGTFIALDRLVQNVEYGRNVDPFGTVYEMRLERCHMVQNEAQYIFIFHCLQFVLENFFPHMLQSSNKLTSSPANITSPRPGYTPNQVPSTRNSNVFFAHTISHDGSPHGWKSPSSLSEVHQNPGFLEDEGIAESGL